MRPIGYRWTTGGDFSWWAPLKCELGVLCSTVVLGLWRSFPVTPPDLEHPLLVRSVHCPGDPLDTPLALVLFGVLGDGFPCCSVNMFLFYRISPSFATMNSWHKIGIWEPVPQITGNKMLRSQIMLFIVLNLPQIISSPFNFSSLVSSVPVILCSDVLILSLELLTLNIVLYGIAQVMKWWRNGVVHGRVGQRWWLGFPGKVSLRDF